MKTTKNLKTIISMVLVACIMLTGNAATVRAEDNPYPEDARLINGTTITMKLGEEKRLNMTWTYGEDNKGVADNTKNYAWASSDETIVSMWRAWDETMDGTYKLMTFGIRAEKVGTATITGTPNGNYEPVSITIKVTAPKVTAKQKKCKHTWKVTKKATCVKSGMKTCKKCKLQKIIKRKNHDYDTDTKEYYTYTYDFIFWCEACVCDTKEEREYHNTNEGSFQCQNKCEKGFSTKEYGSIDEAKKALSAHQAKEHREYVSLLNQFYFTEVPTGIKNVEYKEIQYCTQCGFTEAELDLMFKVNDPTKTIFKKDL